PSKRPLPRSARPSSNAAPSTPFSTSVRCCCTSSCIVAAAPSASSRPCCSAAKLRPVQGTDGFPECLHHLHDSSQPVSQLLAESGHVSVETVCYRTITTMSPFITADQSMPGPYPATRPTTPPHDPTSRLDATPALTTVNEKTMPASSISDLPVLQAGLNATLEGRASRALPQPQTPTAPAPKVARIVREEPEDLPELHQPRPSTPREQTDPMPDALLHATLHPRPRNRSPYSRSHLRSQSSSSLLSAPPMTRAHSLPSVINTVGSLSFSPARPSSPLRSPARSRSPFKASDETYSHSGAPSVCDISEDAELQLTPRGSAADKMPPLISFHSTTLPRNRRRPASPLYQVSNVPFGSAPTSTPTSTHSSPLLSATKFNEPFPSTSQYSSSYSSSVPSTPTSMRSRSPSISSLETIPDSPDAEEEAIEADRIAKLKAAADAESAAADPLRRGSLDVPGETRTLRFGKRDARKRWSVCGAERRGDLDLETIWESAD
ncbi:uncharacterized protein BDZ99DRAFT_9351, partial [Mytilinidion resinicola]